MTQSPTAHDRTLVVSDQIVREHEVVSIHRCAGDDPRHEVEGPGCRRREVGTLGRAPDRADGDHDTADERLFDLKVFELNSRHKPALKDSKNRTVVTDDVDRVGSEVDQLHNRRVRNGLIRENSSIEPRMGCRCIHDLH